MNPGVFFMRSGGSGGGGNGHGGKGNADGQGGSGQNGGNGANGGGKNANGCDPGSGAGRPNPKPRLWALAGLPPPNGVYQGGVDNPANPAWNPAANQGQNASTATFNDPGTGAPINPGASTFSGGGWVRQ
ncbi:hypothetical protein WME91_20765 [Sorangium sp. So ce269]